MLFKCDKVRKFYDDVRQKLNINAYNFSADLFQNERKFLLGHTIKDSDNLDFILSINLTRYVWLAKWFEKQLSYEAFKNKFNFILKVQKRSNILASIRNINIDEIWN